MSMASHSTLQMFTAPHLQISWYIRIVSVIRAIFVFFIKECPMLWSRRLQGARNPRADMEGPYYILGAPDRQLEEGKAVLATTPDLKTFAPYLMTIAIKTPKGDPVPYATFDWWQADTAGSYSNTTYRFRGKFKADVHGVVEVLTVAPGEYGPEAYRRAGHFHVIMGPGEANSELEVLTTQLYVCPDNNSTGMNTDFLNFIRAPRRGNMVRSWCIPGSYGSGPYMGFSEFDSSDTETMKRVEWWNRKLVHEGHSVVAGAYTEIRLNKKGFSL